MDEAQELSELAWRMLMRRCPSRSMTLVGDLAQTGEPGGASSWQSVLGPYLADRWRLARLGVSYRSAAEIAAAAADVLTALAPEFEPPRPVRATGVRPWPLRLPDDTRYPQALAGLAAREVAAGGWSRCWPRAPPPTRSGRKSLLE